MVDITTFRQLALSFPGTEENPHFDRAAFKVTGKRIFTTLHTKTETVNVLLSVSEQQAFCAFDVTAIYPVPNKFGLQGWTTFELNKIELELISEALRSAYGEVINSKK